MLWICNLGLLKMLLLCVSSVPPHIPSCEVPRSVFVGSDLELLCKDKQSAPPATYSWYKDNRALKVSSNTPYHMDTRRGTLVSELPLCDTWRAEHKAHTCAFVWTREGTHVQLLLFLSLSLFARSRNLQAFPKWILGCIAASPPTVWGHPKAAWRNN